jgi:hypothetical protein
MSIFPSIDVKMQNKTLVERREMYGRRKSEDMESVGTTISDGNYKRKWLHIL